VTFLFLKRKLYKIVNREYHFEEGEDHIHYDVGHIPKGTGFMRKLHELTIYFLSLINKV